MGAVPDATQDHMPTVMVWGTYDTGKPRVRIMLAALRRAYASLREVHVAVWDGVEDKSQERGLRRRLALAWRWLRSYPGLLYRFVRSPRPDVVVVGYLGTIDVLVLWPWARLKGVPIVWDAFLSLHDTVVHDRRMVGSCHPAALALYALEWLACRAADCVVLDTDAHAALFERSFGLPRSRLASVMVGVEDDAFTRPAAAASSTRGDADPPTVLFYGQFIPLHGVETIVEAATLLRDAHVRWVLVGTGQEAASVDERLRARGLANVERHAWVRYGDLATWIAHADVCLGIFGTSGKAARVIPNKVFQVLAAGRPLVTRDSPAMRELVGDDREGVALIPAGDALALADAVLAMLQRRFPRDLHADLMASISAEAVGARWVELVRAAGTRRDRGALSEAPPDGA